MFSRATPATATRKLATTHTKNTETTQLAATPVVSPKHVSRHATKRRKTCVVKDV